MGQIVGAFGVSHILMERKGVEEAADRVFSGMKTIRTKIQALAPDLLVIVTNDHMYNFDTDLMAPFVVGIGSEYTTYGDMKLPKKTIRGHTEFGISLVETGAANGFDISVTRKIKADHGLAVPALMYSPGGELPIVPILTNPNMRPCPSPARAHALGKVLRQTIEENRPEGERVVVLGTGGLSHWLALPKMGQVNAEYDHWVLDRLSSGKASEVARLEAHEIAEKAGNGGLETINWLVMAGAVEGSHGEVLFYEAMPSWLTGMAGLEMHVA
ncbi:hypothetical protein [Novosphingopyxis sp.]|uniref:DODA-type extradiol aromatic ring-opening family dioxygenase n=1 Tax=Novosphingopyxis sp. TaxID=2709690 RepID=UPI003B592562